MSVTYNTSTSDNGVWFSVKNNSDARRIQQAERKVQRIREREEAIQRAKELSRLVGEACVAFKLTWVLGIVTFPSQRLRGVAKEMVMIGRFSAR